MIEVSRLTKTFPLPSDPSADPKGSSRLLSVLTDLNFVIAEGSWTSLTGSSGSGKSTLLTLLAGLDLPTQGEIKINGISYSSLSEDERANFRARNLGFIFQNFRLIPHLNALENVSVPLEILGDSEAKSKALNMLERVGLADRSHNLPGQLSGGEQQRVAVARAFVTRPKILFADEPTGNLDSKNGEMVLKLLKELHEEHRSTLVVVTHDSYVASFGANQIRLKDGKIEGSTDV